MKFQGTMKVNGRGNLEIGGCDVTDLARRFGTPLYILDEELFRRNCREYFRAFIEKRDGEVIYAGKTLLTGGGGGSGTGCGVRRRAVYRYNGQISNEKGIFSR